MPRKTATPKGRSDEIRDAARALIAEILSKKQVPVKPADIRDDMSLTADLGIDSLDVLQIAAAVEKRYKIKIPEGELRAMDDLRAIVAAVSKRL